MGLESPPSPAIRQPPAASLAPGFRFHPTDEELVWYYLKRKVTGQSLRFDAISETDIYKTEPWDLPARSGLKSRDLEWYFFSALDKKYGNGSRMNRATSRGYWKTTGKDRVVRHKSQTVGMKKTLVFHSGRAPGGERTNWVMHEYRLSDREPEKTGFSQDAFVLCRVFQKSGLGPPNGDMYAPFVEEEWNDAVPVLIPADDDDICGEGLDVERRDVNVSVKRENHEEGPILSMACPDPFPVVHKRQSENETEAAPEISPPVASQGSSTTAPSSTAIRTMTTTAINPATPNVVPSSSLEFPLLDSVGRRERYCAAATAATTQPPPGLRGGAGSISAFLPPPYLKLFCDLQSEIHSMSVEKAEYKVELMSTQAMVNILQARVDWLVQENDDLRRR